MSWREYKSANETVADWLPWGGFTYPCVMECKDGSFLGVISYEPLATDKKISLPPMQNGWAVWSEKQAMDSKVGHFLTLCWNPFISKGMVNNPWGEKSIAENKVRDAFLTALDKLQTAIAAVTECRLLEYQELLDYFAFALSLGEKGIGMPEVPLYLDALLTQDLAITFEGNNVFFGDKSIFVLTLPAGADDSQRAVIDKAFQKLPYRCVRRLLVFSPDKAKEAMSAYTAAWCKGRESVKKLMLDGIVGELSGYYTDSYILLIPRDKVKAIEEYVAEFVSIMEMAYVIEEFNLKDAWWGSLPGLFRANVMPPLTGFAGLSELLYHQKDVQSGHREGESKKSVSSGSL